MTPATMTPARGVSSPPATMTPARGVTTIHGEDIASLVLSRPASESEQGPCIVVTPLAGVMEVERRHFLQKSHGHPNFLVVFAKYSSSAILAEHFLVVRTGSLIFRS